MKTVGYVMLGIAGLVLTIAIAFGLELGGLQWKRYFKPKHESVEREVFEETKSYVHGKIQDLGKYYGEYQMADEEGKAAIKAVIGIRFAEFKASHIESDKLRSFLIEMRGY